MEGKTKGRAPPLAKRSAAPKRPGSLRAAGDLLPSLVQGLLSAGLRRVHGARRSALRPIAEVLAGARDEAAALLGVLLAPVQNVLAQLLALLGREQHAE